MCLIVRSGTEGFRSIGMGVTIHVLLPNLAAMRSQPAAVHEMVSAADGALPYDASGPEAQSVNTKIWVPRSRTFELTAPLDTTITLRMGKAEPRNYDTALKMLIKAEMSTPVLHVSRPDLKLLTLILAKSALCCRIRV